MARRAKEELPELPPEAGLEMESEEEGPVPIRREESVQLGAGFGGGGMDMAHMYEREVRIPIWEDSHRFSNGAYRLRVDRVTPEGVTASLGFLPSTATEDQVIARGQGKPGTYLIMPVDEHGEPMRRQPYRKPIDEDHPAVLRYHRSASAGASHSGVAMVQGLAGGSGVDPEMLNFFQTVLSAKDAEKDEMMAYMKSKDSEIARVREETAKMQLAVATDHTRSALEVQQQILEADRARQDFAQQQQLEMLRRQQEAERATREAEAERNQNFYAAMLQQQEKAALAERERREDDARRREEELRRREGLLREEEKRREAWMREQEASRQERLERERQRDREHMELVIKMLEKQNEVADPFKNVAGLLEKGAQLKELVPSLFGSDSGPQGIMGVLTTLATEGMKTFAELQKAQLQSDDIGELHTMPMSPEMAAQLQMQGGPVAQIPEAPMPPEMMDPSVAAQIAAEEEMRRRMAEAFAAGDAPPAAPPTGRHPATVAATASTVERSFDPPTGVVLPEDVKKLEPVVRKKAREGIRELVTAIKSVPENQWQATITTGIMKTPQIIPYITAATIRAALLEGGADAALAQKIIEAVDKTGIVPTSIPRG